MAQQHPLDVIQVKSPCTASWDDMAGDEQRRFCSHCGKFVHNLSAMPRDEAERLVCSAAGSMCVRFTRDLSTMHTVTLDYRPSPRVSRSRVLAVVLSLLTSTSVTASWAAWKLFRKPPPTVRMNVMGDFAPLPVPKTP
jgi:hypothetical protein